MNWLKKAVSLSAAALLFAVQAHAANIPNFPGPWDPGNAMGVLNTWVQQSLNPNVGGSGQSFGRNLLDNGDMWVDQRGTSAATAATTSGCVETSYSADRWCADVNITTGAGQLAVASATPSPPIGFVQYSTLVRNSGSLGQPQCALQEMPTKSATALQGQTVNFSVYIEALAGLLADNGNTANVYLITGTGTAQGLGALRSAVGMTSTTKGSSVTWSATTGIITNATAVVAGQPVWFTASTAPTGVTLGAIYYVSSTNLNSGTSFSVATTYAGAIAGQVVIPSTAGTSVLIDVPYITPVWTGLAVYGPNQAGQGQTSAAQAFGQATAQPFTLSSTAWGKFQTGPIIVPTNVTEAAIAVCFWPNANGTGGSTDGIAFVGTQLELESVNVVNASTFEFRPPQYELQDAYRYYWQVNDQAAGTMLGGTGTMLTTTTCQLVFPLPVTMDAVPVSAAVGTITTTTFKIYVAADTSTLTSAGLTANTNSTNIGSWTATLTTASTAGWACSLVGQTAQAVGFDFGADF
jgi:hypothetical protein